MSRPAAATLDHGTGPRRPAPSQNPRRSRPEDRARRTWCAAAAEPRRGERQLIPEPPHVRQQHPRGHPWVRHVHREVAVEPLRGTQDHQVADVTAPVVRHEQHAVEPERVQQGQHVAGDVLLRPLVRSRPGPPVAGQVGRDDPQPGRRVGQQLPIRPVVLRPAVQCEDGAAVGGAGLGDVKTHSAGLDEGPAHPSDRRWLRRHESDYRERLPRYRAGMGGYRDLFNASIADPTAFWADAARAVTWTREPQRILDDSNPPFYRWFPDGELNTCANALDRHVDGGRADQPALIYDSPVTGSQRTYTYRELLDETARFAGVLRGLRRRQGRPRRHLHADGARGGHRDARVRTARRGAFGGVRRVRRDTNSRRASTTRNRPSSCRPRVASSRRGPSTTSRCSTPHSRSPSTPRPRA